MSDVDIPWKRITRGLPLARAAANDRAPTIDEIQKLVQYPDRRIKGIVYTMASSGIRLGAWDYLLWKHITPITDKNGEVTAVKIIVYAGDVEEYYTFITPEAYSSLKEWMEFRASYGEQITGDSFLMRDLWQTTNIDYEAKWGLADPIDSGSVNKENLKKFASEIPGLDTREFSSCLDSEKYKTFVQNDIDLALSFGFKETPSFIIVNSDGSNPEFLQGALPFPSFKVVIDKKLADLS